MITRLRLERFKNFRSTEMVCGPFTLLLGTNASGKSNLRDAFRLLHGIGRGYRLAEIFGEKYEAGVRQWQGIRGGINEAAYLGTETFRLEVGIDDERLSHLDSAALRYAIVIEPTSSQGPRVVHEALYLGDRQILEANTDSTGATYATVGMPREDEPLAQGRRLSLVSGQPALTQILKEAVVAERPDGPAKEARLGIRAVVEQFQGMRFLDLDPDAMREPSYPGQPLGDRGENLSSVLLNICQDKARKCALTEWVQALTPMDAQDFEFKQDQVGRVLLTLVESNGHRTSAYSASDGTLRFLAIAAALLGNGQGHFYFLEELENGIHPTRLHQLVDLIERNVGQQTNQVMATTHSPQLLRLVSPETLDHTSLVYRLDGEAEGRIQQLTALPSPAREKLLREDRARLYESGWLEDVVSYLAAEDEA